MTVSVNQIVASPYGNVTAVMNPLTGVSTYSAGGNSLFFGGSANNIAFISDSRFRTYVHDTYASCSVSNEFGISCDWLGCGPEIAVGTTGTLEYSASAISFRWTAPSDTPGPWTPIVVGMLYIQSATENKWLCVVIKHTNGASATSGLTTVTTSGDNFPSRYWRSAYLDVISRFRNGPITYNLAASGALSYHMVSMLPWYNREIVGPGVDVYRIGTNDITAGTSADTIFANVKQVFDDRIAKGRSLVICGEPARWGVNASTPMTAGQLASLIGYNKLLASYVAHNSSQCRYVDLYSISRDPLYIDGRPKAGILVDAVHDAEGGAIAFGGAIKAAIDEFGVCSAAPYPQAGDSDVIFNSASTWMHTMGGSLYTGGSTGVSSNGIEVSRISGSDLDSVVSVVDGPGGKMTQVDITSVSALNVLTISTLLPVASPTLAEMGLAIGDSVYFECDVELVSGSPTFILAVLSVKPNYNGPKVYAPTTIGKHHIVSGAKKLITGDANVRQSVQITMPASSTATVRVGNFVTRKVTA